MGEYAEVAIWAEMNGLDFCDMGPEDWIEFHKDNAPASAWSIYFNAEMLLDSIDENKHEEAPEPRFKVLMRMFPDLPEKRAKDLVRGLEAMAVLPEPETDAGEETA